MQESPRPISQAGSQPGPQHDLGGLPAGPINQSEHELNFWEWRVDALVRLLFARGHLNDFAELRRAIEDLSPNVYEELSYYERWAAGAAQVAIEKGVLTREELEQRIAKLQAKAKAGGAS